MSGGKTGKAATPQAPWRRLFPLRRISPPFRSSPFSRLSFGSPAFTLIEVLVAFAILSVGLTLIAAAFSRHLAALQILKGSLIASQLADDALAQESIKRESEVEIPLETPPGFTPQVTFKPISLQEEPVKGLRVEEATASISWNFRRQERSLQMTTGFQPQPSEEPSP